MFCGQRKWYGKRSWQFKGPKTLPYFLRFGSQIQTQVVHIHWISHRFSTHISHTQTQSAHIRISVYDLMSGTTLTKINIPSGRSLYHLRIIVPGVHNLLWHYSQQLKLSAQFWRKNQWPKAGFPNTLTDQLMKSKYQKNIRGWSIRGWSTKS